MVFYEQFFTSKLKIKNVFVLQTIISIQFTPDKIQNHT